LQYYYNPYGIPPIDYRDDLEKQMREKLTEGFEIISITFHDEKVQSRGYGRAGWRETPLVYLLLKAKDASVDRIPALRLDLDFVDRYGPVVLPAESAVQIIDARRPRWSFVRSLESKSPRFSTIAVPEKGSWPSRLRRAAKDLSLHSRNCSTSFLPGLPLRK
jgi:hypothetical protein